jgi:hypothetical protein
VSEIEKGKIGRAIEPASLDIANSFIRSRLDADRRMQSEDLKLKFDDPWVVRDALLSGMKFYGPDLFGEGYRIEFKVAFHNDKEHTKKYIKTMAGFTNSGGGYIYFGIDNSGNPVEFNRSEFMNFDWDSFDQKIESSYAPYFRWNYGIITVPSLRDVGLDPTIVRKYLRTIGVPKQYIELAVSDSHTERLPSLGYIAVENSAERVQTKVRNQIDSATAPSVPVRLRARNSSG